jgi:UPF0716 family protein affecting phage T7 exclusion
MSPGTITDIVGICIALPIFFIEWRARRKRSLKGALEPNEKT